MSFKSIVDCVDSIFFAFEPFINKLNELDVSVKILSNTTEGLHADLSYLKVVTVASNWNGLQDFFEILLGSPDLLGVSWGHSIFNLDFEHHGEVLAVLIYFLVPVDHWLKLTLDTFHYTVSQKLVIVGQ